MAITINGGTGVITGVSVGGLPDGCVANDDLAGSIVDGKITGLTASKLTGALPAISGASLTGISAGFRTGFHAWKNASQSVTHDAQTHITFTQEHYDPNSDYDTSTSVFTAPEDGKYLINGRVRWSSGVHGYMCRMRIYINGTDKAQVDETSGNGTGHNTFISVIHELSEDDEVKLYGQFYYAGGISGMVIESDASTGWRANSFAIQRIA